MRKTAKFFVSVLCAAVLALPTLFTACGPTDDGDNPNGDQDFIDYVSQLTLDMSSETKKQEVTVRLYVDGDTTHFDPVANSKETPGANVADFANTQGYIKARYLAINTPESTGKIEKWGKSASNFTHEKLESAESIIVESDDGLWNVDSTGSRYLLWVWYRPAGAEEYRNLNLEILQNGFALGSSTANNRYGEIASAALEQAKANKLHVFSPASTVDENYYEGEAIAVSIKELRCHADDYLQQTVRVQGIIAAVFNYTAYVMEYDEETETYFGIAVFIGYQTGYIYNVYKAGNEVNVVGSVTEFQGTYQISGVAYDPFHPNDPSNSTIISENNEIPFTEVTAYDILNKKIDVDFMIENEDGEEELETLSVDYGNALTSTTVEVKNLKVTRTYTTVSTTDSNGAISLTCQASDGTVITVRTEVLRDANGDIVTADIYAGKTISVKGLIELYNNVYQVKVYLADHITILD